MELLFANRLDEVSASIAMHLERGGLAARAVPFLERAASVATRLSAHREAIRCLTHALSLLETLPAGQERDERELALRSSLSIELNSTRGYAAPEVEQNLNRVFELVRTEGSGQVPVRWRWVAFTLRYMLGDLAGTREVSGLALERCASDPSCRCEAHHAMGGLLQSSASSKRREITSTLHWPCMTSSIRSDQRSGRISVCSLTPGTRIRSGGSAMRTPRWPTSS